MLQCQAHHVPQLGMRCAPTQTSFGHIISPRHVVQLRSRRQQCLLLHHTALSQNYTRVLWGTMWKHQTRQQCGPRGLGNYTMKHSIMAVSLRGPHSKRPRTRMQQYRMLLESRRCIKVGVTLAEHRGISSILARVGRCGMAVGASMSPHQIRTQISVASTLSLGVGTQFKTGRSKCLSTEVM